MKQQIDNPYFTGIALILLSSIFLSLSNLLGKQIMLSLSLPTAMLLRYLVPTLLLWWMALKTKLPSLQLELFLQHSIRAILAVAAQFCLFYMLMHGTLFNATLLYMTSPLFISCISILIFKVNISKIHWCSLFLGFMGVTFILHPTDNIFNWHTLIGLCSGFFNAGSQMYYHKILKNSAVKFATLYLYSFSFFITLVIFGFYHTDIHSILLTIHNFHTDQSWIILVLIGYAILNINNKTVKGMAYKKVNNVYTLTPFLYSSVLFAGIVDWCLYEKIPDLLSIIGAVLILLSALLLCFEDSRNEEVSL